MLFPIRGQEIYPSCCRWWLSQTIDIQTELFCAGVLRQTQLATVTICTKEEACITLVYTGYFYTLLYIRTRFISFM